MSRKTKSATTAAQIRLLADVYFQVQKLRIAVGNRIDAVMRSADQAEPEHLEFLRRTHKALCEVEEHCVARARDYLKEHPTWYWLKTVKGIGPVLGAKLLSYIDIERADTISALWRYAGLGVIDGKAERLVAGEKAHYNRRLKATMYLVGTSFLRSQSKFAQIYYTEKERQQRLHPELKPIVIHYRAMRKMNKIFLACLWLIWREALGLPTRKPYVHEYLGHTTLYDPWEFSEKGVVTVKA
jgi:hypothetical protein